MITLGIHYGHDSNVAIVHNGVLIFALAEERMTRKKNQRGFPFLALEEARMYLADRGKEIDFLAVVGELVIEETLGSNLVEFFARLGKEPRWWLQPTSLLLSLFDNIFALNVRRKIGRSLLQRHLLGQGFSADSVTFVDHHLAHAVGAYRLSGCVNALVVTIDGKGDRCSNHTYHAEKDKLTLLSRSSAEDSLGSFFSAATEFLGFKPLRHEGKVMGLSAAGDPEAFLGVSSPIVFHPKRSGFKNILLRPWERFARYAWFGRMMLSTPKKLFWMIGFRAGLLSNFGKHCFLQFFKKNFSKEKCEDVAAFAQSVLEKEVERLINHFLVRDRNEDVCLSGGVFANVALNRCVSEIERVGRVFVMPAMDDSGLAAGAALHVDSQRVSGGNCSSFQSIYLGPSYSHEIIEMTAREFASESFYSCSYIPTAIAKALSNGLIAGTFFGRSEWGPRALGNRSILASPLVSGMSAELNERLGRSEFMPFAPCMLEEFASEALIDYEHHDLCAPYMTRTYVLRPHFIRRVPAIVHIDGTVRPQVVRREDNPLLYEILREFQKHTGVPVLLNTSFNMHDEPIVEHPRDAIMVYEKQAIDALFFENLYLCRIGSWSFS